MTEEIQPEEEMGPSEDLENLASNGLEEEPLADAAASESLSPTTVDEVPQEGIQEEPDLPHSTLFEGPMAEEAADAPAMPGRFQRIMTPVLRWTVLFVVVFGLGVLAAMLLRVRPQTSELEQLRQDTAAAVLALDALEIQVSEQQSEISRLEKDNSSLEEQVEEADLHHLILQTLVDVTRAEVALYEMDTTTARASLAGTEEKLGALKDTVATQDRETIDNMSTRLTIVLSELDDDPETALIDLGVLDMSLSALERSLFGE